MKKKKSKKGGNRKKVKSSQSYLAPPSDSYGASFDYEEDYIDQAARDDYSGPVQPAVQAARCARCRTAGQSSRSAGAAGGPPPVRCHPREGAAARGGFAREYKEPLCRPLAERHMRRGPPLA